jgi:cytochrome c556
MNRRRTLWSALVIGLLGFAVVGVALAQMAKIGTGDVIADRQRLMKLNGASWKDVQDKIKAGQFEAVAVNAETMALNSEHIPSLFPKGSTSDKSAAKPEIWEKWSEFESAAKNFENWSVKLRDAARAKDDAQVQAIAKDFGRQACGTCHQPFRVPPKS